MTFVYIVEHFEYRQQVWMAPFSTYVGAVRAMNERAVYDPGGQWIRSGINDTDEDGSVVARMDNRERHEAITVTKYVLRGDE